MPKGQTYNHERVRFEEPRTGVQGWQLTSFPSHSMHLGYLQSYFTPDLRTVLIRCQRAAARDAPWDLFRVEVDGTNLTQLTDSDDVAGGAVTPDGAGAFFLRNGSLWRVGLEDFREEEIARCDEAERPRQGGTLLSHDGRYCFSGVTLRGGEPAVVRYRLDGAQPKIIRRGEGAGLHCVEPTGLGIGAVVTRDGGEVFITYDYEGANERHLGRNDFAHSSWLPGTGKIQGCGQWPHRRVHLRGPEPEAVEVLVEGPYFWHSGSSGDGRWIVADTNWPNEGLFLVSVKARRARYLCHPGNTAGHPQWGHPHPCLSADGRMALFNSDPHGVGQVFAVSIPDQFRTELES